MVQIPRSADSITPKWPSGKLAASGMGGVAVASVTVASLARGSASSPTFWSTMSYASGAQPGPSTLVAKLPYHANPLRRGAGIRSPPSVCRCVRDLLFRL